MNLNKNRTIKFGRKYVKGLVNGNFSNIISVSEFNAVGDGEIDDTQAIQNAINSVKNKAILSFPAGKTFRITDTLTIPVDKIVGVVGNGAWLKTTEDITMIDFVGNKTSGGGGPRSDNLDLMKVEGCPFITDLKFYSDSSTDSYGTAINIKHTLHPIIKDCSFFSLDTAISFEDRNRNALIFNNVFYGLKNYGIHFLEGHNIHQILISDNHFFGFKKALFDEGQDLVNLVFANNLIECGIDEQSDVENILHFNSSDFGGEHIIDGNWFQDHNDLTDSFIKVEGDMTRLAIRNNGFELSSGIPALKILSDTDYVIENNWFNRLGNAIEFDVANLKRIVKISNNTVNTCEGFLKINVVNDLDYILINNNIVKIETGNNSLGIKINCDKTLYTNINNNLILSETDIGENEGLISVECDSQLRHLNLTNNTARQVSNSTYGYGYKVVSSGVYEGVIIKDNQAWHFSQESYNLPSEETGNIIIKDNIDL